MPNVRTQSRPPPTAAFSPTARSRALAAPGAIVDFGLAPGQVQPASLDLRLGQRAWRMRELPAGRPRRRRPRRELSLHEIDLSAGAVLETDCVYLCELLESWRCPTVAASTNPKSSTGRIDVFTRVICDGARAFDQVPAGYAGRLFAEVAANLSRAGAHRLARLSQIRFRTGHARLDDEGHRALHAREKLVTSSEPSISGGGVAVSIDLSGFDASGLVGWRAKRHQAHRRRQGGGAGPARFLEPIFSRGRRELVLDPGEFYILASKAVRVPPDHAAEMTPFDHLCRRVPRTLCRLLLIRASARARRAAKARARWKCVHRRALHSGRRADRRPPRLRAHGADAACALRRRAEVELPGAGA